MKLLIIDTSSEALYIAAADEKKEYVFFDNDLNKKHSEKLLYHLDKLLETNNLSLNCFDCFCCVAGPGSFTGIRIGITTVRAFAQIFDKPVMAVNSLQLAAYNIKEKGVLISVKDAVRDKYYAAAYQSGKEIMPADMIDYNSLAQLKEHLTQKYGRASIVYDKELTGFDVIKPPFPDYCGFCRQKMQRGEITAYKYLIPVYAALSQAERAYENSKMEL